MTKPGWNASLASRPALCCLMSACLPACGFCLCTQCVFRLEHEGWDFLFHGVFCFLVFSNLAHTKALHFYGE